MSLTTPTGTRSNRTCLFTCGGFSATLLLGCCVLVAGALLLRSSRPTAREQNPGAPDLVAGQSVSDARVDAGVQGASVLVIPIKNSSGQIAIITLNESQGYTDFGSPGDNSLRIVVGNIVSADRAGNLGIEQVFTMSPVHTQLSIDYRDQTGRSTIAFTSSMAKAKAFADGQITQQEFVGDIDFKLDDILRYYGIDQLLEGTPQP